MLKMSIAHRFENFALDISLDIGPGVTALFGPSGSGKTSILKAISGLWRPDEAMIALNDRILTDSMKKRYVPPHRRHLGYVFQEPGLFPHLNIAKNLDYGRRSQRLARQPSRENMLIELLGIGHLLARRPKGLSGGERARVALARALLAEPELLLLDEPLAALDQARKDELVPYLERLRDSAGLPMIYVSHALGEVARLAQHVAILRAGQIERFGAIGDVLADPNEVAGLGRYDAGAVIQVKVLRHEQDGISVVQAGGLELYLPSVAHDPGTALRIRILAQDVMLARQEPREISALNVLPMHIHDIVLGTGPGAVVRLAHGDIRILARVTQRSLTALALARGDHVYAVVKSLALLPNAVGEVTQ